MSNFVLPPEGLSFFARSVSPDRAKEEYALCALCVSVVNEIVKDMLGY
jgi:hypothetical protein